MTDKKIRIEQYNDGFSIMILTEGNIVKSFYNFNQEDDMSRLALVFSELGIDANFEEVY